MAHERFKAKVAALEAIGRDDGPAAIALIRTSLADRNGYIVTKAAIAAMRAGFDELLGELEATLVRLIAEADREADPGCRAKDAVANALRDFGCRNAAPFVAGLGYVQFEPAFEKTGKVDTAGILRATCARTLVSCDLEPPAMLELLVDHFVDPEK